MKKILEMVQYEWLIVYLFVGSCLLLFYHLTWVFALVSLVLFLRLLAGRNLYTILIAVTLASILTGHGIIKERQMTEIGNTPLSDYSGIITIFSDPLNLQMTDDLLSGEVEVVVNNNEQSVKLKTQITYWLEDKSLPVNVMNQPSVWLVSGEFQHPDSARNFHVFDYQGYLASQDIVWQLEIHEVQQLREDTRLSAWIQKLRLYLLTPFMSQGDSEWIALHNKLLFNLNSQHYRTFREEFVQLGVAHFFAISGFHLYYIRRLMRYILLRIGFTNEAAVKTINFGLIIYMWLIQWPVGVVRAFFLNNLTRLIFEFSLPLSRLDALSIIGITLLIINPLYILSLGYILSFLMTALIIFFQQSKAKEPLLIEQLKLTLLCLLFSWPLLIQVNHVWNGMQLIYVVVFTLIFNQFIMPAMMLTTLYLMFPFKIGTPVIDGLDFLTSCSKALLSRNNFINYFEVTVGYLPHILVVILFISGLIYLYNIHRKSMIVMISPLIIFAGVIMLRPLLNLNSSITLIDVGQGDAVLYQMPKGKGNWLIDTGGRRKWGEDFQNSSIDENYAERNIIPALKALGVNQLQGVIISHNDIDHMGNLRALSETITIHELYINEVTFNSDLWQEIEPALQVQRVVILEQGRLYYDDHTKIKIFSISDSLLPYSESISNDASLIVELPLGDLKFLTLGDISSFVEERLIEEFPKMQADILKLAHHGSNTSSSVKLLDYLKPDLALISAGSQNSYGHPHEEIIQRLHTHNIDYLSIHRHGAIQLIYSPFDRYHIKYAIP